MCFDGNTLITVFKPIGCLKICVYVSLFDNQIKPVKHQLLLAPDDNTGCLSLYYYHVTLLSYGSKSCERAFFLSPRLSRPSSSDHRVLLLWRPPQLSAKKKRVLLKSQSW